jgi:hypothetical protein
MARLLSVVITSVDIAITPDILLGAQHLASRLHRSRVPEFNPLHRRHGDRRPAGLRNLLENAENLVYGGDFSVIVVRQR